MTLVQHIPVNVVDDLLVRLANLVFGDLSRHGIVRPKIGPLQLKAETGRSAVIDVRFNQERDYQNEHIILCDKLLYNNKVSLSIYSCLFNISGAWKYFQNQRKHS